MSRQFENYVAFLKDYHLPKVTKYFIRETHSNIAGEGISFGKIKNVTLKQHFKNLLNRITDNDLLVECIREVHQFKREIKGTINWDATFSSWYLAYLNENKNALIHFVPFYTQDMTSTLELVEEIEQVFSKLEIDVLNKIGIERSPVRGDMGKSAEEELKRTYEKLKLREDQLLESQRIAKVGSFKWDLEKDEITGTKELHRIFDLPKGKSLSLKRFESYLGKKSRKNFREKLITALKQSDYYELEYKIKLPNGEVKYIVIRTKSMHNKVGKATKMLGIIMDISSLKITEIQLNKKNKEIVKTNKKLKQIQLKLEQTNEELDERVKAQTQEINDSNERYKAFIEQSTEGIWRFGFKNMDFVDISLPYDEQVTLMYENTYFAESNDKMAQLHGFKNAKELIGKRLSSSELSLVSVETKYDLIKSFINAGYRNDTIIITEKNRKGETRYLKSIAIGVIEGNRLKSVWGIQRDITERVLASKSLKESEVRYRFLAENLPLIFWTATPDGFLDFGNQRWFDYIGATVNDLKKYTWQKYVHPDDLKATKHAWNTSVKNGTNFSIEYRLRTAEGSYRWHLVRAIPLKDDSGNIIKWMGTSTDINEQKTYSEKLDKKNKELHKINIELDNLLYSVSHDLKAPMANIEGLISALEASLVEECKDSSIKELIDMMNNSVEKFKKSLLDTIDIVKAQKRGEEIAETNILKEVVEDVKADLVSLIETTGAIIKTDFEGCTSIDFPSKNLKSIIYNLLSNAIKYKSPYRIPEIIVSSSKTDTHKVIAVEDNGLGFEANHLKELTANRLYKNIEGSGVGLYILNRIMDNAGGKIEIESTRGEGSTFTVYFPINTSED